MLETYSTNDCKNALSQFHRNLTFAVVAALPYLLLNCLFIYAYSSSIFNDWRQAVIFIVPLLAYPLAALVLWFCRKSTIVESNPSWLSVSILGSTLCALLAIFTSDQLGNIDPSIGVFSKLVGIFMFATILIFFTIPLTALFYYLTTLRKH
jgi:lipid-A-disaccharide synthase-like uncharacterized protein